MLKSPPSPNSTFISPTPLYLTHILRVPVALKEFAYISPNFNSDNAILFHTEDRHLVECTGKAMRICHVALF
jgi:hypothetical protein